MQSANARATALIGNLVSSWSDLNTPLFVGAKEELLLSNGVSTIKLVAAGSAKGTVELTFLMQGQLI